MMYSKKLVAVIKVNGKVLREHNENVHIPFGSEYSIMLKNLHTRKAQVDITIDGENVLGMSSLLISPNKSTEIEGFLKGKNVTHKFKFIEKTNQISDFRGDKIDDGIVVINYRFEQKYCVPPESIFVKNNLNNNYHDTCNSSIAKRALSFHDTSEIYSCSVSCNNEDGITVHGSCSDQEFKNGYIGILESEKHSMVIHLRGYDSNNEYVNKPMTVQTRIQCNTCGCKYRFGINFCSNCGTSLI